MNKRKRKRVKEGREERREEEGREGDEEVFRRGETFPSNLWPPSFGVARLVWWLTGVYDVLN